MVDQFKLVIDRGKWRCGGPLGADYRGGVHGIGRIALLNEHGYMCCLGFYCAACGIDSAELLNKEKAYELGKAAPESLVEPWGTFNFDHTPFAQEAMDINDDPELSDASREQKLIDLASMFGKTWEFTGTYGDNS